MAVVQEVFEYLETHFLLQYEHVVMVAQATRKESWEEHGCKAGFTEVLPREIAQLLQHARHLSTLDDHLIFFVVNCKESH